MKRNQTLALIFLLLGWILFVFSITALVNPYTEYDRAPAIFGIVLAVFVFSLGCYVLIQSNKETNETDQRDDKDETTEYSQFDFLNDLDEKCENLIKSYEIEANIDSSFYTKLILSKIKKHDIENYKELNIEKEAHYTILNASYIALTTEMSKIQSKAISPLECINSIKNIHISCAKWLEDNNFLSKEDYYSYYKKI